MAPEGLGTVTPVGSFPCWLDTNNSDQVPGNIHSVYCLQRCDSTISDTDMDSGAEGLPEKGNSTFIRGVPTCILPGNEDSFRPILLAIGPYHHRKEELKLMEACKAELIERSPGLRGFEAEVREFVPQILSFYPPDIRGKFQINLEEMIVKDAFFVVFVVYLRVKQVSNGLDCTDCSGIRNFDRSMLQFCVRDLLIADNQLPWLVVDKVSSLVFGGEKNGRFMIDKFLSTVMSGKSSTKVPDDLFDGDPLHLLDLLRRKYLVDYVYPEDDRFVLYSAKELPMRGVNIVEAAPENGFLVGGVSFCGKTATLALPRLTICEHFKHTFSNMAAYEATPGNCNNDEITKFLCLFRGLLRDPESVAIMRKKFILCEGDDETIMELFNKMCQNLHPDFLIYEVSEEDQMFQLGFLDKVKRQSREFYETFLASRLEALGVVAAVNNLRIWCGGLYLMYLNHQMEVEALLGSAMMFILRNLIS